MTVMLKPLLKKLTQFAAEIPPEDPDKIRSKTLDELIPVLFPGYQAVLVRNGDEMVFVGKNSVSLSPLIVDPPPSGVEVSSALEAMRGVWKDIPADKREDVALTMKWLRNNLTREGLEAAMRGEE